MLGAAQPETGLNPKAGISKHRKFICRPWVLVGIVEFGLSSLWIGPNLIDKPRWCAGMMTRNGRGDTPPHQKR
jgi:hypothetical protein